MTLRGSSATIHVKLLLPGVMPHYYIFGTTPTLTPISPMSGVTSVKYSLIEMYYTALGC